jgi:hypothetical protein
MTLSAFVHLRSASRLLGSSASFCFCIDPEIADRFAPVELGDKPAGLLSAA